MSPLPVEPILIVQDKRMMVPLLTTALATLGLRDMDVVHSGADAVRRLQDRRYRLVLCERYMHPISGIDLKTLMNTRQNWAAIPFVCFLSSEREGDRAKLKAVGITRCVTLPLDVDQLEAMLAQASAGQAAA